ncbi:MAG TPA: YicC/YloC family endoribonuclease [Bacteroidales bacterium]|nr:YicC/YloC family endoribonuclease [Bacteroidales bacterium]
MIKSMTGYGKAECELKNKKITVEIKTLNSKNLDIFTKIPGIYREKELNIRSEISKTLERGKVEFVLYYETTDYSKTTTINTEVVKNYYQQLKTVANELNIKTQEQMLQTIMQLPDTLNVEHEEINDEEWKVILKTIQKAIKQVNEFRLQEGLHLKKDMRQRIKTIEQLKKHLSTFENARIEKVKQRLKDNIKALLEDNEIDSNRFEQEIIYYLEKLDITEEKVRLTNHCRYFIEMLDQGNAIGKKLGFIAQEIGREINTIGSKANDSDIQKDVVLMKDELEKIKEQVLNIL